MRKLNCAVGDLAITVNCTLPQNLGTIVRVISAIGFEDWGGHDQLVYTWQVEVASQDGHLYYQYVGEEIKPFKAGPVPDSYLRRLTPPQGYLLDEIEDEELKVDLKPISL